MRAKSAPFWRPVSTRLPGAIDAAVTCRAADLDRVIDEWEKRGVREPPKSPSLTWEKGAIVAHPGQAGDVLDRGAVSRLLERDFVRLVREGFAAPIVRVEPRPSAEQLQNLADQASRYVKSSVVLESQQPPLKAHLLRSDLGRLVRLRENASGQFGVVFDAEELAQVLRARRVAPEWPPKNASLAVSKTGQFTPVPEARGYKFSVPQLAEQLLHAAEQDQTRVAIDVVLGAEAKLKAVDVEKLGIRELMGSFTTFHACCQPRVSNIHRIADLLDGIIVLPGETFSVNETIGPRSIANGFVMAPSIEDGEMVDTIGGGVSQFATTFYNALLRSGLEILERRAHTYWFDRYPMGHEATLSFPKPDLVFRNDTHAGVLIKTEYSDRAITVRLYGDKENRQVAFGVSKMMDVELPSIERLPNPDLRPDKEKVKNGGRMGWSVVTWRTVTLANGEKKKDERKVTYKPQVRRIEVHPCLLRSDELGYTGERCPKIEPESEEESTE
jgi:vancomycin resistance protein YoaR